MPGQFVLTPKKRMLRVGGSRVSRTGREESRPLSGLRQIAVRIMYKTSLSGTFSPLNSSLPTTELESIAGRPDLFQSEKALAGHKSPVRRGGLRTGRGVGHKSRATGGLHALRIMKRPHEVCTTASRSRTPDDRISSREIFWHQWLFDEEINDSIHIDFQRVVSTIVPYRAFLDRHITGQIASWFSLGLSL